MIVLDASVAVGWLLGEDSPLEDIETIVSTRQIVVPAHWIIEVGNATLKSLRRKSIVDERLTFIERGLAGLTITIEPPVPIESALSLLRFSRSHGLTMYDGAYLHLALSLDAELATFDSAMRGAASRLGLKVWPA